jgi:Tol biopolymer transport system component
MADDRADLLHSWKEIAQYLNRGARTVQRWERTENLPIHRHMHERQGSVFAYKSELDVWWASRKSRLDPPAAERGAESDPAIRRWRFQWPRIAAGVFAIAAVAAAWAGWRVIGRDLPALRVAPPTPLTSFAGFEYSPAFSPDGKFVAFTWEAEGQNGADVYVQAVGKGEPLRLTDQLAHESSPCWSPDGQSIAFLRGDKGRPLEIVVKPAFGGAERKIVELRSQRLSDPLIVWSRDPRWLIVATVATGDTQTRLYRLTAATGELAPITAPCADCMGDMSPVLSPDGRRIAFLRAQKTWVRDVFVLDLNDEAMPAGEPRRATRHAAMTGLPVWLPGGGEIAYPLIIDYTWTWHSVRLRDGHTTELEAFAGLPPFVTASPDGTRLAWTRSNVDHNIRAAPVGEGPERDAIASTMIDTNPQISPDGTAIVFPSNRRGNIEVWRADTEGRHALQLTSFPGRSAGTPRWSPDGKEIAFDVTDTTNADIYVMGADGARVRRLTSEASRDFVPSWSRDGKWIYFGSDRSGTHEIWRVSAAGGAAVRITSNGGYGAWESHDGQSLYVVKHGAGKQVVSGIWRVRLSDGAEERVLDAPLDWSRYSVARNGIYFIGFTPGDQGFQLRYLDFKTGAVRTIRPLERFIGLGFSMAPDESWFVYTARESQGSDVVIAELRPAS